jgi:hypothetical protein
LTDFMQGKAIGHGLYQNKGPLEAIWVC